MVKFYLDNFFVVLVLPALFLSLSFHFVQSEPIKVVEVEYPSPVNTGVDGATRQMHVEGAGSLQGNANNPESSRDKKNEVITSPEGIASKIYELLGGNLFEVGLGVGAVIAIGTFVFWSIVGVIVYHAVFAKKDSEGDDGGNYGPGSYLKKRRTSTSQSSQSGVTSQAVSNNQLDKILSVFNRALAAATRKSWTT